MMRSIFILMYCLFWIWAALGLFFKGDYLSSIFNLLLGIFLYFVIFSGLWKRKRKAVSKSTHSSDSGSFWDLFISDSASDSASASSSSESSGGGDGGGGGGD